MKERMKTSNGISLIMLVIVIVIIILTVILAMKILGGNSQGNEYTRAEVISLLEKGKSIDNYICHETSTLSMNNNKSEEYTKSTRKIKENKMVYINEKSNTGTGYYDYSNNKLTVIREDKKIAIVSNIDSKGLIPVEKIYFQDIVDIVKNYDNEYSYIKTEKINGCNCIKIKLTIENGEIEVWIDKENGLVIKQNTTVSNEKIKQITSIDYKIELNCVTDKDVNVPNLKKYKIQEI